LKQGIKLYGIAINKFLGNSIISRLNNCPCNNEDEIRKCLKPNADAGLGEWRDLAGLLAPSTEIDKLIADIEAGKITGIDEVNAVLKALHENYYAMEWTWAWNKIQEYYGFSPKTISANDIINIVELWKISVVELDNLIYEDAKKEFSLSSQTSFGMDGNKKDRETDFEQVRGVFEENIFVKTITEHIKVKTQLGNDMIKKLRKAIRKN
jgi:hypothetical protein